MWPSGGSQTPRSSIFRSVSNMLLGPSSGAVSFNVETATPYSREETLELRQQLIPKACALHFDREPLKITRAFGQYLYDDEGMEYLDCVNSVAHVGHCNSSVVQSGKVAMLQMGCVSVGINDAASEYVSKLKTTFPPEFDAFLFVTSGSEANDLALQLARLNSGGYDVVAVDGSYHGGLSQMTAISCRHNAPHGEVAGHNANWVHVLPCPDLYRGKYKEYDACAVEKHCKDAERVINNAVDSGRKIACFICEPVMAIAGVITPPPGWLSHIYSRTRAIGGLTIADETQCGLGRTGGNWWGFQHHNVTPDIVTIGKPVGNGHPMALVVTRSQIAAKLGSGVLQNFNCDSVVAAIGLAVLNAIRSENLMKNARDVGTFLREGLRALAADRPNIGHVRGVGFMVGVDIVECRGSRKPSREIAERICYKMKESHIIVANEGTHKNVLLMVPPMCFTCENAHRFIITINKILQEIEEEELQGEFSQVTPSSRGLISLGVFDEPSESRFVTEDVLSSEVEEAAQHFSRLD